MQRKSIVSLVIVAALVFGILIISRNQNLSAVVTGGCKQIIEVGKSVRGTPIFACQLNGSADESENALLIIGSMHGDEPAGKLIVDQLIASGAPAGSEIWAIRDVNPDGAGLATRQNANGVDLNRNFPTKWLPSEVGTRTYSGPSPMSEPETRAVMHAASLIRPSRVVVFHQPYAQIDCAPDRPDDFANRLAALTGFLAECIPGEKSGSPTNTYTGTFTIWINGEYPETTALTFELGLTTWQAQVDALAKALRTVALDQAYLP